MDKRNLEKEAFAKENKTVLLQRSLPSVFRFLLGLEG